MKIKKAKIICACSNCKNDNYCSTLFNCYKSIDSSKTKNNSYGCFKNPIQDLQCEFSSEQLQIKCCNDANYCNLNLTDTNETQKISNTSSMVVAISIILGTFLTLAIVVSSLFILYLKRSRFSSRNNESLVKIKANLKKLHQLKSNQPTETALNGENKVDFSEFDYTTTGSGPGELIQRTISRDVHINYEKGVIGKGRYGVVWSAKWNDDLVAVKSFFSIHEQSWSRETEIYQTCMLRHENILGYIASDIKGNGCSVSMLLITEYHPLGSLYDFLLSNKINKQQLTKFLYSIANGLNHLHQEIFSSKYKPCIVHRDLKTKNVLVKNNMECCIADFGLAVRYNSQMDKLDYGMNCLREGTVRYLAPEILNHTLNSKSIHYLKSTDIYSFSLIIWETLIRLDLNGIEEAEEHRPPYFEYVQGDPSIEQMKDLVCVRKIRPPLFRFESVNLEDNDLKQIIEMMNECWKEDPNSRLTSLNIKKKLKKMIF